MIFTLRIFYCAAPQLSFDSVLIYCKKTLAKVIININIKRRQCRGQGLAALWEGPQTKFIITAKETSMETDKAEASKHLAKLVAMSLNMSSLLYMPMIYLVRTATFKL